ncbi:hypothetical protein [Piscinibacter sp.]|uniref:hypothetical protein n=1 Tax=Piscinibacter sp. TaxID=1903157 RepID=UPI002BA295E9|nr:hypothetical protein [Albitalea sp.]HUG21481.1 hypothetical protein [Albitalea sp.]
MKPWLKDSLAFWWVAMVVLLASFAAPASSQTSADYTHGVSTAGSTQAMIWFEPTLPAALVDVHYNAPGLPTQSFRMAHNAGTWEKTVGNLAVGSGVDYWFTYEKQGSLFV